MRSGNPAAYRLAPRALIDIEDIWLYGARTWSPEQADRYADDLVRTFELLAALPEMARERGEFRPPVRIHIHASHLVVYVIEDMGIVILRVLGGGQAWQSILAALD